MSLLAKLSAQSSCSSKSKLTLLMKMEHAELSESEVLLQGAEGTGLEGEGGAY